MMTDQSEQIDVDELNTRAINLATAYETHIKNYRPIVVESPGWHAEIPTADQLVDFLKIAVAVSIPGPPLPYFLPERFSNTVIVLEGAVDVVDHEDQVLRQLFARRMEPGHIGMCPSRFCFYTTAETAYALVPQAYPTRIMLLSWVNVGGGGGGQ